MRLITVSTLLAMGAVSAGCGLVSESSVGKVGGASDVQQPWEQPVRKAICGPLAQVETGLQGQVPAADRASGRSQEGYNCNLELVGQWQGDGAGWQHAWFEDCAYYGTTVRENREHYGVVVIDAATRSNPHPSAVHRPADTYNTDPGYLTTPAMMDPWESLKVNEKREMLGAVNGTDNGGGPELDVYDISQDCRDPKLIASVAFDGVNGHEGNWQPDGQTYWGANGTYWAVDMSNVAAPELLTVWDAPDGTHGLVFSDDGTRGYFTTYGLGFAVAGSPTGQNGFVIADTSDVQFRKPDPEIRVISHVTWTDGSTGQHPILLKIGGKPYLIYVDELGTNFAGADGPGVVSCGQGLPPWGMARMFDISDEVNPALVAKFMLETNDPANCAEVLPDVAGQVLFSYDSHYCSVDDLENATALACGNFNSGIRVYDIRSPYFPREIAYFNPPAQLDKTRELPGSHHDSALGASGGLLNADWCSAAVRFVKERGELWTTCQDNGFMILKFTNGVWPFKDN